MSLCRHIFPFLLGGYLAVDLLDYIVKCMFNLITKSHYFPYWLYHCMCDRNRYFAFSPPLGILCLFNFSHSSKYVMILHCDFNFHFISDYDAIHLFMWLSIIHLSFLVKYLLKSFAHFYCTPCLS